MSRIPGIARLTAVLICALLAACGDEAASPANPAPRGESIEAFLARHWSRPIPTQGPVPTGFGAAESALDPESCGTCHLQQWNDWQTSLHSKAMGPGVLGQLLDMPADAGDEHQTCLRCHAPLAEQAASLSTAIAGGTTVGAPAPSHTHGLTCAGCHVRQHTRYGPPRRDGSAPQASAAGLPHGGWTASAAFEDAGFCAACHQFGEGDFSLNGKYLENTYEEWRTSRYARDGKTCQSCHMPDRRHLWRGVHDEAMMKSAVTISLTDPVKSAIAVEAKLEIRNTGTGHRFPTYVTPKVVVEIFQSDRSGKMLQNTLRQHVIARQVEGDLSREISDTRLAPDEAATLIYRQTMDPRATALTYRVRVEPDAFYSGLFDSLLAGGQADRGKPAIRTALENSLRSNFTFYEEQRPLPGAAATR